MKIMDITLATFSWYTHLSKKAYHCTDVSLRSAGMVAGVVAVVGVVALLCKRNLTSRHSLRSGR